MTVNVVERGDGGERRHGRFGAVVLCGGESRRMGVPKDSLAFGGETMLERTVRMVSAVVTNSDVVVVAAADQQLPSLPTGVRIVRDATRGAGPLPAVVEGLAALPPAVEAAFVTGCDAPLLRPEFIRAICSHLASADVAVPTEQDRLHPLAAVYRKSASLKLQAAAARGVRSLHGALRSEGVVLNIVPAEELRESDPQLESLMSCNTPEEYSTALRVAGFSVS